MIKRLVCFVIFLQLLAIGYTQDLDVKDFKYLQSYGTIPYDFTLLFSEKFEQDKILIAKEEKRSIRKSKEDFLKESNFIIDQMLLSGRILFNDPVSNYINKVADNLLESDPELRKQLRFYVAKSPSVNAFSTDKGIIVVNLGLVAQLENEAQLAYILAHEIVHYVKKHSLNLFLEKRNIILENDGYKVHSKSEKYFATNYRNQEIETEADKLALQDFFAQSKYSLKVLDGVFDVLQYSYLPFDDVAFEKSFFETEFMKFPDNYFLTDINPIKGDDDYDKTKSTHPSIQNRRDLIQIMINELSNSEKKEFLLPKEEFYKIRTLARFEAIHQYIVFRDYGEAIYNSFILLKEYPGNKFLQTSIAYCMYALSEYKIKGSFSGVLSNYKNIEGESQQLYFFLNSLNKDEITALALHYTWQVHKQFPRDEFIKLLCDRLFDNLVVKNKKSLSDFFRKPKEEIAIDYEKIDKQKDTVRQGKYDKIKKNKAKQELKDDSYIKYVFVDLFKDSEFFETFTAKIDINNSNLSKELSPKEKKLAEKKERKEQKLISKHGEALGIDTVLIIDPFYFVIDERKNENMRYFDSENKLLDFSIKLNESADKTGLAIQILNPKSFNEGDVSEFNDLGRANDWIIERFNHDNSVVLPYETKNSREVMAKFNTSHIAWTGIISVRKKKEKLGLYILASIVMPLYLPYTIPMMIMPSYDTYYYYVMFDTKTGLCELKMTQQANANDRTDFINSWIYFTMHQVKNSR